VLLGLRLLGIVPGSGRGCYFEEVAELGLEAGAALPAGEGVAVDVEGLGDRGGGVAGDEEAEGAELVGGEGARGAVGRWVRFAPGVLEVGRVGAGWGALGRAEEIREIGEGLAGDFAPVEEARERGFGFVLRPRFGKWGALGRVGTGWRALACVGVGGGDVGGGVGDDANARGIWERVRRHWSLLPFG
jgi:hypothetical protein